MVSKLFVAASVAAAAVAAGVFYLKTPSQTPPPPIVPSITGLPVTMKLKQRSTAVIPGSEEKLSISVDDITSGQVMVSVVHADGRPVLGTRSLAAGASAPFDFDGMTYSLSLAKLDNKLIGDDFATVTVSLPGGGLTESQKIEHLITEVETLAGVFIRNGTEHSATDAAKLLRHKRDNMDHGATAEQFIEQAGTKSSTTGEPYQIRFPDGKVVPSADFLHEKLKELDTP